MTAPSQPFATRKNQVRVAQSLPLAGAAVDAAARTEGLFELSVCPPMTALTSVARGCADKVATTAQTMAWDDPRSLTGETSATDLTDLGRRNVIIGHSERRGYLAETDDMIAQELRTAFAHRLAPILCLGDSLEEPRAGSPEGAVRSHRRRARGRRLAAGTTLLYGGSVTDANIDAYLTRPDIDGALVGTASQQLTTFQALINATIATYRRMQPAAGH